MPGIAGIVTKIPGHQCQGLVKSMISSMEHESFYISGDYAVPELGIYAGWVAHENSFAAGQVFFNEERDIAVIFSGECFADPATRGELIQKGHRLDSPKGAWLAHLYEEKGSHFWESLNGLFSGVLIDKRKGKAFLFNDRYGTERIYWHDTRDAFYFASEAKALLRVLPELREFDHQGVAQFLTFGCTVEWRTLFRGVHLLPGGSAWSLQNGRCEKRQYFDSRTWESLPRLAAESFESQFEETFKRILPGYFESDSPLAIALTGGLDTRMILACRPKTAETFVSYTFTGKTKETLDDRAAARVAKVCGFEHRLVRLGADFFSDFGSHVDETVYVTDGCFGATGAHEIYLNRKARELGPVRLTGLFGSEILRGISTFKPSQPSMSLLRPEFAQIVSAASCEFPNSETHPIASAAFRNIPWNLFGSVAASRSQVVLRTPYLDNELVALAFQVPESLRKSPDAALRVVRHNDTALGNIPTDRRIEDRDAGFPQNLRRLFFEVGFKADYFCNEGMPGWLCRFDPLLNRVASAVNIFGHHKFLHYRSWFRNELAPYVTGVLTDPQTLRSSFWNPDFLEHIATAHTQGRGNYIFAMNAVLTLQTVERLLFRELPRDT